MARKAQPPVLQDKELTAADIDSGTKVLQRRIDELRALQADHVSYNDTRVAPVESAIRTTIREVFGDRSHVYHEYGDFEISPVMIVTSGMTDQQFQGWFDRDLPHAITKLDGLIRQLEEKREFLPQSNSPTSGQTAAPALKAGAVSRKIFIVHGRDNAAKETVARYLEKLRLEPIILHEQANQGQTIIEKFERHADVGFAVVLLTPDDVGALESERQNLTPRARQNVVFEFGFFIGRLGRRRVCALYQSGVELPSDLDGLVYVRLDDRGWKLDLAREVDAAGIDVDLNLAK